MIEYVDNAAGRNSRAWQRTPAALRYSQRNTGGQGCAMTMLDGFAAGMSHGRTRLGDCWVYAVSYYYDHEHLATLQPTPDWYPASIFFQGMKFMVFGDPSLQMPPRK